MILILFFHREIKSLILQINIHMKKIIRIEKMFNSSLLGEHIKFCKLKLICVLSESIFKYLKNKMMN